jgi:hypothetical protein
MSELRADDDVGISSVRRMGVGDLATARAPDRVNWSQPEPDEVRQTSIRAAITEVRSDRQTKLGGDYFFEQLPAPHDQIGASRPGDHPVAALSGYRRLSASHTSDCDGDGGPASINHPSGSIDMVKPPHAVVSRAASAHYGRP